MSVYQRCKISVGAGRYWRSNDQIAQLADAFKSGRIRHQLERENDYITNPTRDGYRSLHLIYQYHSDRNPEYNGQRIEVQLRSRLQHAWATAVETVDFFTSQDLKSNLGRTDYARFFSLMGSWIADREESNPVPSTPDDMGIIIRELRELNDRLNMLNRLRAFRAVVPHLPQKTYKYHILDLDLENHTLRVTSFPDLEQASTRYANLEEDYRSNTHKDVLLASVHGASIQQAYPNYFADTGIIIDEINLALSQH